MGVSIKCMVRGVTLGRDPCVARIHRFGECRRVTLVATRIRYRLIQPPALRWAPQPCEGSYRTVMMHLTNTTERADHCEIVDTKPMSDHTAVDILR